MSRFYGSLCRQNSVEVAVRSDTVFTGW